MDRFAVAGLGGTFDHLHKGHYSLLKTAFKVAEKVIIGLTIDVMLTNKAYAEQLQSYEVRQQKIIDFVSTFTNPARVSFVPLNDPFGPAITSDEIEALVISAETLPNAEKINQLRAERKLPPVVLVVIPLFPNGDGEKLSSTEIRAKLAVKKARKKTKKSAKQKKKLVPSKRVQV
ncbi:MAG: Phosphopantetheine adenylyltransferase [Promethearchaeota archaeon CR_4]|nr:MAG: Phosphopantetheine adenylyltransferase [Candidatus Lokiarchaeota archaeon CR_4]